LGGGWTRASILECFDHWFRRQSNYPTLPALISWYIWLERNLAIFESKAPSMEKVCYQTSTAMTHLSPQESQIYNKRMAHSLPSNRILGWFDGASQRNEEQSGAGGVIKLNDHTIYKFLLNCGGGANTRAELLGSWAILSLAQRLVISDIHIMGDSKIIIDWLNDSGSLQVTSIDCWKDRVKELIN
jgi:hypothetical protein